MTFYYLSRCLIGIFQTLLFYTIEKENIEIIKILLNNPRIDINQKSVHFYNFLLIFII